MPTFPSSSLLYRRLALALGSLLVLLLILALLLPVWRAEIGILARLLLAGICFTTSLDHLHRRKSTLAAVLVALVGLGLILTAVLGYGFNGSPLTSWLGN